jgi:aryl-alcohol dehydrogenase-like predicted oxidoreductase
MQTIKFAEYNLSKLMLGTVQFGLDYGISNNNGRPSSQQVRDIITCAMECGINCLDTARSYGISEEAIHGALSELKAFDNFTVFTKVVHIGKEYNLNDVPDVVRQSVLNSIGTLGLDSLPMCMLHLEGDFRYIDSLVQLKNEGLVKHIGVSVETAEAAKHIVESGLVEAIQAPISMLDRRFLDSGVLQAAHKRGVAVFARSVYLQGLILMDKADIPEYLSEVTPIIRSLKQLAEQAGISLAEMAVRYVLGLEGISALVMGVLDADQLHQDSKLVSKGPLDPALIQIINEIVPSLPEEILLPGRWITLRTRSLQEAAK